MKSKTTIEVNGKRYDAITGAVIGEAATVPVKIKSAHTTSVDGFFRSRVGTSEPQTIAVHVATQPKPEPRAATTARSVNHARTHAPQSAAARAAERLSIKQQPKQTVHHSTTVNHSRRHAAQSTQTLRRDSVRRPEPSFTRQAHAAGELQLATPSLIAPKASVASVDTDRLARAAATQRSPQIARHGVTLQPLIRPAIAPLAVQPAPSAGPTVPTPATPPPKPGSNEPAAPTPPPAKPTGNIFDHALANASNFVDTHAHVRHHKKQVQRHLVSMAAGTLALVVIAAFAVYQNTPGLQFRVASLRAGIGTGMPDFQAAGFALNNAGVSQGRLTVGLSNSSGNYSLVQQTTNLSAQDMIRTVGATDASGYPIYQTVQAGDVTVYRFANNNATWIKDGVWYTVNGNGALSDSQIKNLVQNV